VALMQVPVSSYKGDAWAQRTGGVRTQEMTVIHEPRKRWEQVLQQPQRGLILDLQPPGPGESNFCSSRLRCYQQPKLTR
jgi:hypothetical protein